MSLIKWGFNQWLEQVFSNYMLQLNKSFVLNEFVSLFSYTGLSEMLVQQSIDSVIDHTLDLMVCCYKWE